MIFTTGIHGNEPIPTIALASVGQAQIVCNLKALGQGVRFLEMDMNKAFGTGGNTYEEQRALEVLKAIPENEEIVDLHTMSAISEPFAIVVDEEMISLARKTGLKHVVFMKHNIKGGHSLINLRSGISIEAGLHNDFQTYQNVIDILNNLKSGQEHPVNIYEVYGQIEKEGDYKNFLQHPEGFIPVLAGEKAYNFPGLKARLINQLS